MNRGADLSEVSMRLSVDGRRFLFLSADVCGFVRRAGREDVDILSGLATPNPFPAILRLIGPELLRWTGQSWSDPRPKGRRCRLAIGFKGARESMIVWDYGSESPEPPPEILGFVLSAVATTDAWYLRQRALARPESAGWRLLPT